MPTPPKGAKWTEPPKVVTRLNYRSDRVGFTDDAYRHIFVIPADGGTRAPDHERRLEPLRPRRSRPTASGSRSPSLPRAGRRGCVPPVAHLRGESRDRRDQAAHAPRAARAAVRRTRPTASIIAFMSADSVDHSAWAETKLWVMNADGSNAHARVGQSRSADLRRDRGRRTTAASTSTSRAKARRTSTSRRRPDSSTRVTTRQARADGERRRQERPGGRHSLARRPSRTTS